MNRQFIWLVALLLLTATTFADGIRWIGYSDIHYCASDGWSWNYGTNSTGSITPELYYDLTNYFANFYVASGDLQECTVGAGCVTNCFYYFTNDASVLTGPYFTCPGNHDVPNGGMEQCWTNYFPVHRAWTNGNYIFISLKTYNALTAPTTQAIDPSELDYLETTITNARPLYTNFIVMAHHGVAPDIQTNSISPGHGLERLTNILNAYSVVMWMHGHTHTVDPSVSVIPNTITLDFLIPSLTRSFSGHGVFEVFQLTNTTLINTRIRTDTHALVVGPGSTTNTVPQFIANWPPTYLACDEDPKPLYAYSTASSNSIVLHWPANPIRQEVRVSRRVYTNNVAQWQAWTELFVNTNTGTAPLASSFTDTPVTNGVRYEYQLLSVVTNWVCYDPVFGYQTNGAFGYYEYINTGHEVPLRDTRGKMILLVESGLAASIGTELQTLTNDLIGDGYKVVARHDVAAKNVYETGWFNSVTNTKALVVADYNTDPTADWTIFIIGHVPIPYAGESSPGGHTENLGAHPADWYYADTNVTAWTDTTVSNVTAIATNEPGGGGGPETNCWNVPGDGKFDQSTLPSVPEMRVARIDFYNLPAFASNEVQLTQQYLKRDHQWRTKQFTARELGIVCTNSRPWEAQNIFSSYFGSGTNGDIGNWLTNAYDTAHSYLVAANFGNGRHQDMLTVGPTEAFAAQPLYAVFCSPFGSYYGDWDSGTHSNEVIHAPLAANGYGLTCFYRDNTANVDWPAMDDPVNYELHALALNRFTPNLLTSAYLQGLQMPARTPVAEEVRCYTSFLGDPTLRLRNVFPPTNVLAAKDGADFVISWSGSTDTNLQGYHVYRAPTTNLNMFTRLTTPPTNSPYRDASVPTGTNYTYWVRAVKLEQHPERSYYNSSEASFSASTSASHTNYYVAKTGNDSNIGTSASPFLTVGKAESVAQAGDSVFVATGTYAESVIVVDHAGSPGEPITFNGQGVATVSRFIVEISNIWVMNFTFTGGPTVLLSMQKDADFCIISNNIFDGAYDTNLTGLLVWNGPDALPFGNAASDNLVISNLFEHGAGFPLVSVTGDRNVVYGNRLIDSDTADWFRLWGRTNHIVANLCSNDFTTGLSGNHPDFIQTFGNGGAGSRGMIIESNYVVNGGGDTQIGNLTQDGISDIRDWTFRNNLFVGINSKSSCAMEDLKWYNNTFVDCGTNISNGGSILNFGTNAVGSGEGGRVLNNVFLNCGNTGDLNHGWYTFPTYMTNVAADYNYVAKDHTYAAATVNSLHQSVGDPGGWDTDKWWENHGVNGGSALFVNQDGDWHVATNSIIATAGTNLTSIFTKDIAGVTRPAVGGWTIGAYEVNTGQTNPPTPPSTPGTFSAGAIRAGRVSKP